MGTMVSDPSHLSEMALTRYWEGSGSKIGMVNTKTWGSSD